LKTIPETRNEDKGRRGKKKKKKLEKRGNNKNNNIIAQKKKKEAKTLYVFNTYIHISQIDNNK